MNTNTNTIALTIGSRIVWLSNSGQRRSGIVSNVSTNIKGGRAGFDCESHWGYAEDLISIDGRRVTRNRIGFVNVAIDADDYDYDEDDDEDDDCGRGQGLTGNY